MRFTSGHRLSHPSSGLYLYVKLSVSFAVSFALSKEKGKFYYFRIAKMFETDVDFFGTFPVSYLGLYEVLSNDSGTNHSIDGIIKNSKGEEI